MELHAGVVLKEPKNCLDTLVHCGQCSVSLGSIVFSEEDALLRSLF